jgi:acyl carrier protein
MVDRTLHAWPLFVMVFSTHVPEIDRATALERICAIIHEMLPRSSSLTFGATTTANDVPGWDSLAHVKIILGVEKAFKIRIRTTEMAKLDNIGSLVDLVVARAST